MGRRFERTASSRKETPRTSNRELLAAEYGLKAFTKKLGWKGKSIRIRTDSMVALAYLDQDLTISAEWIPTGENLADGESRIEGEFSETRLNPRALELIQERFGSLEVDLFATGDNAQTPIYVSLKADPGAWYVDAFSRPIPSSRRVFANPRSSSSPDC